MTACSDFLDRPQQTKLTDDIYWRNDEELRLHANDYYPNYFVGYNSGWGSAWAPQNGLNFSDDQAVAGKQSTFENSVPSSRESTATSNSWLSQYVGATWNFAYVRKANIFINRFRPSRRTMFPRNATTTGLVWRNSSRLMNIAAL